MNPRAYSMGSHGRLCLPSGFTTAGSPVRLLPLPGLALAVYRLSDFATALHRADAETRRDWESLATHALIYSSGASRYGVRFTVPALLRHRCGWKPGQEIIVCEARDRWQVPYLKCLGGGEWERISAGDRVAAGDRDTLRAWAGRVGR